MCHKVKNTTTFMLLMLYSLLAYLMLLLKKNKFNILITKHEIRNTSLNVY